MYVVIGTTLKSDRDQALYFAHTDNVHWSARLRGVTSWNDDCIEANIQSDM